MKNPLHHLAFLTFFFSYADAQENLKWVDTHSLSGGVWQSYPVKLGLDPSGNVYVGGGDGDDGGTYFSLVKYNSSGVKQWSKNLNSPLSDLVDMVQDASGNSYCIYITSASTSGLIKIDHNGDSAWFVSLGYHATDIAIDQSNNLLVCYNKPVTITRIVVEKYNSSGVFQWSKSTGADKHRTARYLTADANGNVYATGHVAESGYENVYTIAYDGSGNFLWSTTYGGGNNGTEVPKEILLDGSANIYIRGLSGCDGCDDFVVKYSSNGVSQWSYSSGTLIYDMEVDNSGNVYLAQHPVTRKLSTAGTLVWENMDYTPIKLSLDATGNIYFHNGGSDIGKIDNNGNTLWLRPLSENPMVEFGSFTDLTSDNSGNAYHLGNLIGLEQGIVTAKFSPCSSFTCNYTATKKVTNISGPNCNNGSIKITRAGTFNSYQHIELYDKDNVLITEASLPANTANYTFSDLISGTYHVKVFDESCCETDFNNLKVKCPKPTGISVTGITSNGATVNWSNTSCNDGYKLQYRKQGTSAWTTKKPGAGANSFALTGLLNNTIYEYRLASNCVNTNKKVNSGYSAIGTFTTNAKLGELPTITTSDHHQLFLYPNPAQSRINVSIPAESTFLIILNNVGEVVFKFPVQSSDLMSIDISSLANGIYQMQLQGKNEVLATTFVKH